MKTKTIFLSLLTLLTIGFVSAQDRTTVTATSSDISDNLDLRAVASIFGESRDLQDFERRLNDPKTQISNLDLNGDGNVDYLRVIETTEQNLHLVVVQAVLDKDVFQDVATIEVEKDGDNVQVQVVGDTYMYGPNYIYEPVYVTRPPLFAVFWGPAYRPYYSPYYYNYYPDYYSYWRPYPIYRYRRNVHVHINVHNHYNYVNINRSPRAQSLYSGRRQDGYERLNPGRSFTERTKATNKRDFDQVRRNEIKSNPVRNNSVRNNTNSGSGTRNNDVRTNTPVRASGTNPVRTQTNNTNLNTPNRVNTPRSTAPVRSQSLNQGSNSNSVQTTTPVRSTKQNTQPVRQQVSQPARTVTQPQSVNNTPRVQTQSTNTAPRVQQRNEGMQRTQTVQPARQANTGRSEGNRGGRN